MLRQRLVRNAGPTAFAAAVCVMAIDSARVASAQGRLEAEYAVTVAGITIARGNWVIDIGAEQFTATAGGTTTGFIHFFTNGRATSASRGTVSGGQLNATSYAGTINYDRKVDDVRMSLAGGTVKDYTVAPLVPPHPDRIPLSDADRRGVLDPMTATLTRVPGNGDLLSPQACNRKVPVFDGRIRYDVHSEYKRMETVKAQKGYQGPALVCALQFRPISGYVPDRPIIKFLVAQREAEVWLVPIAGTRVLAPFRFSMPTPIGFGVLQATHFVSVAHPSWSNATAKAR